MSQLIGLMGYAQSGKDTVAQTLVAELGFQRIAFADALRDMLYALNPFIDIDVEYAGGNVLREFVRLQTVVDHKGWDRAKVEHEDVRGLLQRLGTEAGRNVLGQNIWVDTAMKKATDPGKYVFTDVRFPNEYYAILSAGGELWRIVRPGTAPVNGHASETALDGHYPDVVIHNTGNLAVLRERVLNALVRKGTRP